MVAAVSGLSPVHMMVLMPMARSRSKRSMHSRLDSILQVDDAQNLIVFTDNQRCTAHTGNLIDQLMQVGGDLAVPGL